MSRAPDASGALPSDGHTATLYVGDTDDDGRTRSVTRRIASFIAVCVGGCVVAPVSFAQDGHLGGQARADAARRMIVLAVQQGISSLPPASGQALVYEYDHEQDTYARSAQLGPTALRSTRTVGRGRLSLRVAVSYLDIDERFDAITYLVEPEDPGGLTPRTFGKLGLDAQARVGVVSLAATYGLTPFVDVSLMVPVTLVQASAGQSFTTDSRTLGVKPGEAKWTGFRNRDDLEEALALGVLAVRRESFRSLGFDFNDGTHVGVGRISLAGRAVVFHDERWRLGLAQELLLPSPSENEFAGSESLALLPRVIGEVWIAGPLRLLADVGYEYDTRRAELRRFVGSGGVHLGAETYSVDVGLTGSVYDTPIRWTPQEARGLANADFPATRLQAQQRATLGDDFVDFVAGIKLRLASNAVLSGAVSVPLNDQGFRPAAVGTLALEVTR